MMDTQHSLPAISKKGTVLFWAVHIALVLLFFYPVIFQPGAWMLHASYDGLKNYFTLQAYLQQPDSVSNAQFSAMQYPYGESIWYTDNSPLIAWILRLFSLHVHDISGAAVSIFNYLMVAHVLLAPVVLLRILRRLLRSEVLIISAAILITWLSPQMIRMFTGTMNLSMSLWYFLVIWQLIRWMDAHHQRDTRGIIFSAVWMSVSIILAACIHLYYLLLLGMPLMLFIGIYALMRIKSMRVNWWHYFVPMMSVAFAVMFVLLLIRSTDPHLALRTETPDGTSYPGWEMRFFHLYKAKQGINLIPFIGGNMPYHHENGPYLGLFFWISGMCIVLSYILQGMRKRQWKWTISKPMTTAILVMVLVFYAGSGLFIYFPGRTIILDNYLNPLFYVSKLYPPIEHFRCIGRMGWWVFYSAYFGLFIVFDRYLILRYKKFAFGLLIFLFAVTIVDMSAFWKFGRSKTTNNVFSATALSQLPDLDYSAYQAILPIPYYNVGSEDYPYTLDDPDAWSKYTYQLYLHSQVPLMSVKLSRTPKAYAHDYINMLLTGEIPDSLNAALNDKPILVVYDSSVKPLPALEPANSAAQQAPLLIQRHQMQPVWQSGTITYYAWYVH